MNVHRANFKLTKTSFKETKASKNNNYKDKTKTIKNKKFYKLNRALNKPTQNIILIIKNWFSCVYLKIKKIIQQIETLKMLK